MKLITATLLGKHFGTQLVAGALALTGAGGTVGGNLGLAHHYAHEAEIPVVAKFAITAKRVDAKPALPDRSV